MSARFQFKEKIGFGGFGEVWRAEDCQLRRDVAIKLFTPGGSTFSSARDHAQALARVEHPNVVRIYDMCELEHPTTGEEWSAIVMELLEGPTLEILLKRELAEVFADRLCDGLLLGLEALHGAGIVHTDICGDNIMMHAGEPKLLDVLYRGTLANQCDDVRQQQVLADLRRLCDELARILDRSCRADAAAEFRRVARQAKDVAGVRAALQSCRRGLASSSDSDSHPRLTVVTGALQAEAARLAGDLSSMQAVSLCLPRALALAVNVHYAGFSEFCRREMNGFSREEILAGLAEHRELNGYLTLGVVPALRLLHGNEQWFGYMQSHPAEFVQKTLHFGRPFAEVEAEATLGRDPKDARYVRMPGSILDPVLAGKEVIFHPIPGQMDRIIRYVRKRLLDGLSDIIEGKVRDFP